MKIWKLNANGVHQFYLLGEEPKDYITLHSLGETVPQIVSFAVLISWL